MASLKKVLYTGITNDLQIRVKQHKMGQGSIFTKKYNVNRLVWYEETNDVMIAIEWEKKIKGWSRQKKIDLIENENPEWKDLSIGWF
jgi:putative endonuclease